MRAVLATLAAASLGAVLASACSAAPYVVNVCAQGGGPEGIEVIVDPSTHNIGYEDECTGGPGTFEGFGQRATGPPGDTAEGGVTVVLNAPPGTKITTFHAIRETTSWMPDMVWLATNGTLPPLEKIGAARPSGDVDYAVNAPFLITSLQCAREPCKPIGNNSVFTGVRLRKLTVTLEDEAAPTVGFGPLPGEPVEGIVPVPLTAEDSGGGIAKVELLLDGQFVGMVADSNGGHCTTPFKWVHPCRAIEAEQFQLDTTSLPVDGTHTLRAIVTDAAGQSGEATRTIEVHNAPTNTARPQLSGTAALGSKLSVSNGEWKGAQATLALQWLRCPAAAKPDEEAGCDPIPGASAASYEPASADAGKRIVAKVTATNAFGASSALSPPSDPVPAPTGPDRPRNPNPGDPPRLTGVKLTPKRFHVGKATVLRYTSSKAGTLTVKIAPAKGKAPTRTLTRKLAAGPGRLRFNGRIGRKPLRPGAYRMTVTATDADGNVSAPAKLRFTILSG